jgi:type II secretory pathway component GspD/PulD (secretin)
MKIMAVLGILFLSTSTLASDKTISFSFKNKDVTEMIELYAKESARKFVVDPGVRGKASIFTPGKVTIEEAFNLLSDALAANGYAISERDDTSVVLNARDVQRDLNPVSSELPSLRPQRLVTYIYTCKYCKAPEIIGTLRNLASKNGELYVTNPNKLVICDFSSNVHRVHKLLAELDQPTK